MAKSYSDLNHSERKLQKISIISFGLQFGPLFGYSLNKDMYYIWLVLTFIGSLSMLIKLRWIRPKLRYRTIMYEIILTALLIVWLFSESISVPIIIKQLLFFIVLAAAGYRYFNLLYEGHLAKND
ncbi:MULTISPECIES: hypothetical protein [Paenibacillus]|uniref:hypothetical protein n=1 Tax=Paenibacillus TaxID=44249 RepID=UPI0022B89C19|nr:hypothetical protein [Paenibacillus caseinilyticus]MCZ8521701.1 hypothetical protein [Paenibacillus caseinilyticus]